MMQEEAMEYLKKVRSWKLIGNSIEKDHKFSDFKEAIDFINKVADAAQAENHHPDILLWGWNNVKLTLTTHKIGGLSKSDFTLAAKIDQIYGK